MSNAETPVLLILVFFSPEFLIYDTVRAMQAYIFLLCFPYSGWIPKDNMQVSGMKFYNPPVFLSS